MYKVLLHIGLPKTATTSLQDNVLYQVYKDQKLNFLGRSGDSYSSNYFFPLLENMSGFSFDKSVGEEELVAVQNRLRKILKRNKLNVISEECLSLTHGNHYVRILNMQRLLSFCDVKVLLSVRQPSNFFLSYYAEMYRWEFYKEKSLNNINKFIDAVMSNKSHMNYDILFYDRFVKNVMSYFSDVNIVLYEDLLYDKDIYFKELGRVLNLESEYLESLFMREKCNVRKHNSKAKISEAISLDQHIARIVSNIPFKRVLKKNKFVWFFYNGFMRNLRKVPLGQGKEHIVEGDKRIAFIKNELLLSELDFLYTNFNCLQERLVRYGYIKVSSE